MKEDILEQLVDDYLKFNGYFTAHNVKFQPAQTHPEYVKKDDCVASDIDVIGFHPRREGPDRAWVVSCKSWQLGFDPKYRIAAIEGDKRISGRKAWQSFRELVKAKWADGLILEIERLTGCKEFTYITAVTKLRGDKQVWQEYKVPVRWTTYKPEYQQHVRECRYCVHKPVWTEINRYLRLCHRRT